MTILKGNPKEETDLSKLFRESPSDRWEKASGVEAGSQGQSKWEGSSCKGSEAEPCSGGQAARHSASGRQGKSTQVQPECVWPHMLLRGWGFIWVRWKSLKNCKWSHATACLQDTFQLQHEEWVGSRQQVRRNSLGGYCRILARHGCTMLVTLKWVGDLS